MNALLQPTVPLVRPRVSPVAARPTTTENPNWLWWLFLSGVVALAFAGPACALG